jgi:hypothetical protein
MKAPMQGGAGIGGTKWIATRVVGSPGTVWRNPWHITTYELSTKTEIQYKEIPK